MRGIVNFLEKAGLVTLDEPTGPVDSGPESQTASPSSIAQSASSSSADFSLGPTAQDAALAAGDGVPVRLEDIYAEAGIAASAYPAERLLRLIDGLSAMDPTTRLMAIKAMDAADESWTIDDPLADAEAKVQALQRYSERLQAKLQKTEQETQARLEAVAARQEKVVGDIRKQIAELEALVAREEERAAQERAEQDAQLKAARDQTASELVQLAQASQRLQGLSAQFGATTTVQE